MSDAMWMRGVEWLAAAATDPRLCKREWDQGEGIALLEAGRYWDVLSVPDRLGLLTLDLLWQAARPSPGPTLVDTAAHRVGFFLPPDPGSRWIGAGLRRASRGPGWRSRRRTGPHGPWNGWSRRTEPARCTRPSPWSWHCARPTAHSRC